MLLVVSLHKQQIPSHKAGVMLDLRKSKMRIIPCSADPKWESIPGPQERLTLPSRASDSEVAVGSGVELSLPVTGLRWASGKFRSACWLWLWADAVAAGLWEPCPQRMSRAGVPASGCEESILGQRPEHAQDSKHMLSLKTLSGSPTPAEKVSVWVPGPAGAPDFFCPHFPPVFPRGPMLLPQLMPQAQNLPQAVGFRWHPPPGLPKFISFHIGFHKNAPSEHRTSR